VPHQASAPGQPPATDTGRLLNSIGHTVGSDADGLYADVSARVAYAVFLELGTRYMAPRPFLRPALRAVIEG
jgi:HK97 gp10 family phage protein